MIFTVAAKPAAVTSFSFVSMLEKLFLVYVMFSFPANTVAVRKKFDLMTFPPCFLLYKNLVKKKKIDILSNFQQKRFQFPRFFL